MHFHNTSGATFGAQVNLALFTCTVYTCTKLQEEEEEEEEDEEENVVL
jgi:hypothetical protein